MASLTSLNLGLKHVLNFQRIICYIMELLKRERGDYMSTTLRGVIYTILIISIILIIFLGYGLYLYFK
ncbi:hypothetical protein ABH955_000493 [Bacillus sp. RC240]